MKKPAAALAFAAAAIFISLAVNIDIIWPLEGVIAPFFESIVRDPVWQISIFSLVLNVLTAIVLLAFIQPMNKLVYLILPERPEQTSIEEIQKHETHDQHEMNHGFTDKF